MAIIIKPMTVIFIGAIIVAVGTLLHNKSSSKKSTATLEGVNRTGLNVDSVLKQNSELKAKADTLQAKIDQQLTTIDDLRKENTELHAHLASKAMDIYYNVTGKGHPIIFAVHEFDIISLIIENNTDFPIYDVNMIFPDPTKAGPTRVGFWGRTNAKMRMEEYASLNERIIPFNVAKGEKHAFYTFKYPEGWNELVFAPINIITRSGSYIGKIVVKRSLPYGYPYESEIADLKGNILHKTSFEQ